MECAKYSVDIVYFEIPQSSWGNKGIKVWLEVTKWNSSYLVLLGCPLGSTMVS